MEYKINDWVFCEFKLQQIREMDGDRVTSVSDSRFSLSGNSLGDRCFPLDLNIKNISDSVAWYSDKIHALNHNGLNHPDIHRELINRWVEMCHVKDDKVALKGLFDSLADFYKSIEQIVSGLSNQYAGGVKIFR